MLMSNEDKLKTREGAPLSKFGILIKNIEP